MLSTRPAYGAAGRTHDGSMRSIPDPGFPDDDGEASPEVAAALLAYDADPDRRHDATLAVLQHARLLVPVVAVLGEVEHDERGLAHDKTSDMATVLMTGRDGRSALLAFTSTEALHRWNPEARPVPVPVRTAAAAAVQDGAQRCSSTSPGRCCSWWRPTTCASWPRVTRWSRSAAATGG